MRKSKVYAVCVGKDGPQIYDNVVQFQAAIKNVSGSSGRGFETKEEAVQWMEMMLPKRALPTTLSNADHPQIQDLIISPRPRYLNSSTDWTEYVSPLNKCSELVFYVDSKGEPPEHPVAPINVTDDSSTTKINLPLEISDQIQLSPQQKRVLEMVKSGRNVFFTGPAGTGKSVLLREIIKLFRDAPNTLAVTAPTGIAGLNIQGTTIHSFSGIGLGKEPQEKLYKKIRGSQLYEGRWKMLKALIIDEISMLDAVLFDKLEYIARKVRDNNAPFGGIQLVISGDFFQLPPVPDRTHKVFMPSTYAFDAHSWNRCMPAPVNLTRVFRQQDNDFIEILSAMRAGELTAKHIAKIRQLSRSIKYDDGIEPSQLFPLRAEVENLNRTRLKALSGPSHIYLSNDSRGYDVEDKLLTESEAKMLLDRLVAVAEIELKVGAQVMLIRNIIQGQLVNGSAGKVVDFLTTQEAIKKGIKVAELELQRSETQEKKPTKALNDPRELVPTSSNIVFGSKQLWPVVVFTNGMELLCAPIQFSVEGYQGNIEANRLQVPLILAWALSIHKSQGQTLTRVKVDLGRVFEKGQAYVALSRATTMESLEVVNFHPDKVKAHPRVIAWQKFWTSSKLADDEMDSEEAIARHWDLS